MFRRIPKSLVPASRFGRAALVSQSTPQAPESGTGSGAFLFAPRGGNCPHKGVEHRMPNGNQREPSGLFGQENAVEAAVDHGASCFGTKRSQVQILSPRLEAATTYDRSVAASSVPCPLACPPTRALELVCPHCGKTFYRSRPRRYDPRRNVFCSRKCSHDHGGWKRLQTATPPSTKAQRVYANGVINYAVKTGKLERPTTCSQCGRTGCRIDGHHDSYSAPGEVMWLCRSCRVRRHMWMAEQQKAPSPLSPTEAANG
jgi:endogenous inhibitor of DNA gyrase (YacG/DUF329 family)